jgi:hypothetical protein
MDFESIAPPDYATRACSEEGSEVRTREEVAFVPELVRAGWNDCEIARETRIPRQTILDWRKGRTPDSDRVRTRTFPNGWFCAVCRGDSLTLSCVGCTEVASFSKHWPCLFPQHGPGKKHERKIELTRWQQELVDLDPRPLVRGLLHSDGCRVLNRVNGTPYPRYHFTNVSADIRGIFGRACDQLGIEWRPNDPCSLSVARRGSVALLDEFVGPKR